MRLKLDENVPTDVAPMLADLGHDTDTVADERLLGRDDGTIWSAACAESRMVVTFDVGFVTHALRAPGAHPGVLLLRLHDARRRTTIARLIQLFAHEANDRWVGRIVVATETRVRIRSSGT
jgi:predicted nuclease of predicted toxin-antitoxin system